jgi:predicted nucleic acid-binding protein
MLKYNQKKSIIITTINKPNKVINKYLDLAKKNKAEYIIIADKKTPLYKKNFPLVNLQEQKKLEFLCVQFFLNFLLNLIYL